MKTSDRKSDVGVKIGMKAATPNTPRKEHTVTSNDVADYFLWFTREHGDSLTNLKLQKLVYYAQAWHLALYDKPLFREKFEAWVHGPVEPDLYQRFRKYQWAPITEEIEMPELDKKVIEHLQEVFGAYGRYSAWDLEQMTHSEEPWKKARGNAQMDDRCETEISEAEMAIYYRQMVKAG